MVKNCWERNSKWTDATSGFRQSAMEWNRKYFGKIYRKKKELIARLQGISKSLDRRPNDFL